MATINQEKKLNKILISIKKNYKKNHSIAEQLDSIQMLELITKIEEIFKIKISSKDINSKNFFKIKNVENLIKKNVKSK
tara:strand:+ start:2426 stop:2662 length:237 start_codon:yes stop_codon:yes gene_type:complete